MKAFDPNRTNIYKHCPSCKVNLEEVSKMSAFFNKAIEEAKIGNTTALTRALKEIRQITKPGFDSHFVQEIPFPF